jgi:hypothetical protein
MGNRVLKALGVKSPIDARVVTKMKAAGLVSIGRTSVPEMACGNCPWACENEAFGYTRNPWIIARTAIDSSGAAQRQWPPGLYPSPIQAMAGAPPECRRVQMVSLV